MKIIILFLFSACLFQGQVIAQEEQPFTYVEKMPAFPGGLEEMYKFIYKNLKYPEAAKKWKVEGAVITQFIVDAEGYVRDIRVVKELGYGLDEEAMRVVELMNAEHRWIPGSHNGIHVPVIFSLPIKFVLKSE